MTLLDSKLPARNPRYSYLTANLRTGALMEEPGTVGVRVLGGSGYQS